MRKKFIKILVFVLCSCFLFAACSDGKKIDPRKGETVTVEGNVYAPETAEKTFDKAAYRDKILGALVGHSIGLGSGFEFAMENSVPKVAIDDEYFEQNGKVATGTLGRNDAQYGPTGPTPEAYQRILPGLVRSDDDNTVNILNQYILEKYGAAVSYEDISAAWKFYDLRDAAGGLNAVNLINKNDYIAPFTGANVYGNYYYGCTEPWIHNMLLGLNFPGMPTTASAYLDMFGSISGDYYVLDVLQIMGLACTYSLEDNDARSCLQKAMAHIGKSNALSEIYEYVKECYKNDPEDWRTCVKGIYARRKTLENMYEGEHNFMAMNVNFGFMATGIVFGDNDFEKTLKITSLSGFDGDCTAAGVGALLGACHGYDAFDSKYKEFLGENSVYQNDLTWPLGIGANFPNTQTLGSIVDKTVKNTEMLLAAHGGKVENGKYSVVGETYTPVPQPTVASYDFENGTEGWTVSSGVDFSSTGICAHSGKKAGTVLAGKSPAEVSQKVSLVKGDIYELSMFVYSTDFIEVRLFARDGSANYERSFVNILAGAKLHSKVTLQFVASSDAMDIGIRIYGKNGSEIVTFDDVFVKNVSDKVSRTYRTFDAETCMVTGGVQVVEASTETGKAVRLPAGEGLQVTFDNNSDYYNAYRLYYSYDGQSVTTLEVYVDGNKVCKLPLVPQGSGKYLDGNYVEIFLSVGKGEHTLRFKGVSGSVDIDKIVVRAGAIQ